MKVDRWVTLLAAMALILLMAGTFLGCDDDDDDATDDDVVDDDIVDDDAVDDDVVDDDTSVDDDTADDDTVSDYLTVEPWAEIVPAGTTFAYQAEGMVGGAPVTTGFTWTTEDGGVATVDVDGVVTGVAAGQTTVTATLDDLEDSALVLVGPDVFAFDNQDGLLMAVDRGSETGVADLLAGKGSIGTVLQDINLDRNSGTIYLVDSGDWTAGITGEEKLILVNLLNDLEVTNITLNQDSPWAATMLDSSVWITGNLDDTLARVDIIDRDFTPTYYDLDEGCVPADIVGIGNYLYVACTGFDLGSMSYAPGKVLVIDASTGAKVKQIDLPQVNPTHFATVPCEDDIDLFVTCTGDYGANTGKVVKICTMENVVKSSFDLGTAPGPMSINGDGIGFVGEGMAGNVYVFNAATNAIIRGEADPIVIPGAFWIQGLGTHPNTGDAYVCDQGSGAVYAIDADDYSELFDVALTNPGGVAFW